MYSHRFRFFRPKLLFEKCNHITETSKKLYNLRCEEVPHKYHEKLNSKKNTGSYNASDDYGTQTPIRYREKMEHTVKGNGKRKKIPCNKKCESIENKKRALFLHKYSNHRALNEQNWYNESSDNDSVCIEEDVVSVSTDNFNVSKVDVGIYAHDVLDTKTKLEPRHNQEFECVSSTVSLQDTSYTDNKRCKNIKKNMESYECGDEKLRSRKKTQKCDGKHSPKVPDKVKSKNKVCCCNNKRFDISVSDIQENLINIYENIFREIKQREICNCTSKLDSKLSIPLAESDVHRRCKTRRRNAFKEENLGCENRKGLRKKRNNDGYYKQHLPKHTCIWKNIKKWTKKHDHEHNFECPCSDTTNITYQKKLASQSPDKCKQDNETLSCIHENNLQKCTCQTGRCNENLSDPEDFDGFCYKIPLTKGPCHCKYNNAIWPKKQDLNHEESDNFECHRERHRGNHKSEFSFSEHGTYNSENNLRRNISDSNYHKNKTGSQCPCSNDNNQYSLNQCPCIKIKGLDKKNVLSDVNCPCEDIRNIRYTEQNNSVKKNTSKDKNNVTDLRPKNRHYKQFKSITDSQDSSNKFCNNQQHLPKQCCRGKNIKVWTKGKRKNEKSYNSGCPCVITKIPCQRKVESSVSNGRDIDIKNNNENLTENRDKKKQISNISNRSQFNSITNYYCNKENHPGDQNIDKNIRTEITNEERNQLGKQLSRSQNCSDTEIEYNCYPNKDLASKGKILSCTDTQTSNSYIGNSIFSRTRFNQTDVKAKCSDVKSSDFKIECKPIESENRIKDSISSRNGVKRKGPDIVTKMRCLCTRGVERDLNSLKIKDDDLANKNVQWYKDLKNQPEHALASCFKNKVLVKNNLRSKKFVSPGLRLQKVGQLIPFIKGLKISLKNLSKNSENRTIINQSYF